MSLKSEFPTLGDTLTHLGSFYGVASGFLELFGLFGALSEFCQRNPFLAICVFTIHGLFHYLRVGKPLTQQNEQIARKRVAKRRKRRKG